MVKQCKFCSRDFEQKTRMEKKYCSRKCLMSAYYRTEAFRVKNASWQKQHRKTLHEKALESSKTQQREIGFPDNVDYYKPFAKVNEGYGYEGVILCDKKTGEIQCHACGAWFHWLHNHIRGSHKLTADQYREKFGLDYKTALCSEKVRDHLVKRAMTYPWERLMKQKKELTEYAKSGKSHNKKYRDRTKRTSMEEKNKNGTCSLQLIDRMVKLSEKLGRQPYTHEMISERGTNIRNTIRTTFGNVKEMRRLLAMQGYMYEPSIKTKYTDKFLLKSLKKFADIYKRRPSTSDFNRGLLPSISVYERRFGGIGNARKLAFTNGKL